MSRNLGRKIRKGMMVARVRELREQHARVEATRAAAALEAKNSELDRAQSHLANLEDAFVAEATAGVSARMFLQMSTMRQLHVEKVNDTARTLERAGAELDERREVLVAAAKNRRAADKLVDVMQSRHQTWARRRDQKTTDDTNCARSARGSGK